MVAKMVVTFGMPPGMPGFQVVLRSLGTRAPGPFESVSLSSKRTAPDLGGSDGGPAARAGMDLPTIIAAIATKTPMATTSVLVLAFRVTKLSFIAL
jgi:hypothetical protein